MAEPERQAGAAEGKRQTRGVKGAGTPSIIRDCHLTATGLWTVRFFVFGE